MKIILLLNTIDMEWQGEAKMEATYIRFSESSSLNVPGDKCLNLLLCKNLKQN